MSKIDKIEEIHDSLVNGNRKQCIEMIDSYGVYDFWEAYESHLCEFYPINYAYKYFTDMTISYFRIKGD